MFCLFVLNEDIVGKEEKAYFRKLFLKLLGEIVSYEFQALHPLHGEGGVRQGDGALAGPAVVLGAGEVGKQLQIQISSTSVITTEMNFLAIGVTEIACQRSA